MNSNTSKIPSDRQVVHTCNPSTQKTKTGGFLQAQDQSDLQWEFQISQGNMAKICFKQNRATTHEILRAPKC